LPVSYGCVRMKSRDVIELYNRVGTGARVDIFTEPLARRLPKLFPPTAAAPAPPVSAPQPSVVAGEPPESPRPL
ncbi:MAG: L,D-transpeptidase family protein, partial [Chthoniobacterales bacterium]